MPGLEKQAEKISVALVDDEGAIRYLLSHWLKEEGYVPLLCSDAREALELFSKSGKRPGLLVTDVHMPEVSGMELAEQVCRRCPSLPVVFISGYVSESDVVSKSSVRHMVFLAKPFGRETFLSAVQAILSAQKPGAPKVFRAG